MRNKSFLTSNLGSAMALGCLCFIQMLGAKALADLPGGDGGGGGDRTEMGVDLIRGDLLNWIQGGGAEKIIFPTDIPLSLYKNEMTKILAPQKVVVHFTTTLQENLTHDEEQKVIVDGVQKTCRGFRSTKDQRCISYVIKTATRLPDLNSID